MAMHKQLISFTEPQLAYLKSEAKRLGIPVSDLNRRIVDHHRAHEAANGLKLQKLDCEDVAASYRGPGRRRRTSLVWPVPLQSR